MQSPIAKIERLPLRKVWPHEAHFFTTWLADNLDVLSEAVGVELNLVKIEARAGAFSVDILAKDDSGRIVVIENQLERSDHDHLGKLMTYLAAFEAAHAIWIVGEARSEHAKAIAWLNDSSSVEAYLIRAEAIRIGESQPALLLTPIIIPSVGSKTVARDKQELAESGETQHRFWTGMLKLARSKSPLHDKCTPNKDTYQSVPGTRKRGHAFVYAIKKNEWRVELKIDTGSKPLNKAEFDLLFDQKETIEQSFGGDLEWLRHDGQVVSKVCYEINGAGYASAEEEWPAVHAKMVDAMIRLEGALRPAMEKNKPVDDDEDPHAAAL